MLSAFLSMATSAVLIKIKIHYLLICALSWLITMQSYIPHNLFYMLNPYFIITPCIKALLKGLPTLYLPSTLTSFYMDDLRFTLSPFYTQHNLRIISILHGYTTLRYLLSALPLCRITILHYIYCSP